MSLTVNMPSLTILPDRLLRALTPRLNRYIPYPPTPKQAAFLLLDHKEALYGGAARGGKSVALLMAALQYFDCPGYHALILRRTLTQADLAESILSLAEEWLAPHIQAGRVKYDRRKHTFYSQEGGSLTFGYLKYDSDKYHYQGAAFHFIAFDELTQFLESTYRYMFSRLTRKVGSPLPIRMRSASNPGGIGHIWVKARFILAKVAGRIFLPANVRDNPHVDYVDYVASLQELDPVTKAQLLDGNWDISIEGKMFSREMFSADRIIDWQKLPDLTKLCRFWDLAATEPSVTNPDPDYTVGALVGVDKDYVPYLVDVKRCRKGPTEVEKLVLETAVEDYTQYGSRVEWAIELEGGSGGPTTIAHYDQAFRKLGYTRFSGIKPQGTKAERANSLSILCGKKGHYFVNGPWLPELVDRAILFPLEKQKRNIHDDDIDAWAGGFNRLFAPTKSKKLVGRR